jgi:hypothetical protein
MSGFLWFPKEDTGIAAPRLRQSLRRNCHLRACPAHPHLYKGCKDLDGRNMLAMTKSNKQETS